LLTNFLDALDRAALPLSASRLRRAAHAARWDVGVELPTNTPLLSRRIAPGVDANAGAVMTVPLPEMSKFTWK
jgi:hypothetical protein